jgi:hypothetical protein
MPENFQRVFNYKSFKKAMELGDSQQNQQGFPHFGAQPNERTGEAAGWSSGTDAL